MKCRTADELRAEIANLRAMDPPGTYHGFMTHVRLDTIYALEKELANLLKEKP